MTDDERLIGLLERARDRGLVGPGPVAPHLDNARGFAEAIGEPVHDRGLFVDLGSGAGLPGLALAVAWTATKWLFVDGSMRSVDFLREATAELGIDDRVAVEQARAEDLARDGEFRGSASVVTARSFGPPGVTAECAAGFLVAGGTLIVSEPPRTDTERWPAAGLMLVRQRLESAIETSTGHHFAVIEQVEAAPDRYPRRAGIPQRRPLF